MRSILPYSRLVVAGMLVFISAAAVFGHDPDGAEIGVERSIQGRTEFEVSDAAPLPSSLHLRPNNPAVVTKTTSKTRLFVSCAQRATVLLSCSCSGILLARIRYSMFRTRSEAKAPGTSVSRATRRRWHHGKAGLDHVGKGSQRLSSRNRIVTCCRAPGCATPIDTASSMSPLPSFALRLRHHGVGEWHHNVGRATLVPPCKTEVKQ